MCALTEVERSQDPYELASPFSMRSPSLKTFVKSG
jgi:hypothetical protein